MLAMLDVRLVSLSDLSDSTLCYPARLGHSQEHLESQPQLFLFSPVTGVIRFDKHGEMHLRLLHKMWMLSLHLSAPVLFDILLTMANANC